MAPLHIRVRAEASQALLEVSDTGEGMAPEVRDHIFERLFTTKGPRAGTGLGLAIVHAIVEEHDGTIEVQSHPGEGTTFRIALPLSELDPVGHHQGS